MDIKEQKGKEMNFFNIKIAPKKKSTKELLQNNLENLEHNSDINKITQKQLEELISIVTDYKDSIEILENDKKEIEQKNKKLHKHELDLDLREKKLSLKKIIYVIKRIC